jgi:hypothetical protein
MRLFCINLKKRSTKRREEFHARWIEGLGFDVEYFDAVDKYSISESELERGQKELDKLSFTPFGTFDNHRYSPSGVMACSLSHQALLKSIQHEIGEEEGVVVFEDDVIPLEGADRLKERITLARRHLPQVEAIICNGFTYPIGIIGFQVIEKSLRGERVTWDEAIHTTPVEGSGAALVKISPPGSFFMWYSREGVSRMVKLIEGREFLSVDILYGAFAQQGVLAILTPGLGYHPRNISTISTTPMVIQYAN